MTELIPFDLEAAKAGAKVLFNPYMKGVFEPCHYVGEDSQGKPVIQCRSFGMCTTEFEFLRMAPTPVKRWRVIYRGGDDNAAQRDFDSEGKARFFWDNNRGQAFLPFPIEVTL